jgi:hypothetical protein
MNGWEEVIHPTRGRVSKEPGVSIPSSSFEIETEDIDT